MLKIQEVISDDLGILTLTGNLIDSDALALTQMVKEILQHKVKNIIIDLSAVNRMNSCYGLGVIMTCWGCVNRAEGKLIVASVNPKVKHLFEITKINAILKIVETVEEAKKSF